MKDKSMATKIYTCPMHPEVQQDKPGKCPKCGMKLVRKGSHQPMASHNSKNMGHMGVGRLLIMAAVHFAAMYALMYAMVNSIGHIYPNLNQLYMAGIMTAPMLLIEILLMKSMYNNKKALTIVFGSSIIVFALSFLFIRNQTAINNEEFLRSMIPHHSGAILMCSKSSITDPEIKKLCQQIVDSQQREIDQMEKILNRLETR